MTTAIQKEKKGSVNQDWKQNENEDKSKNISDFYNREKSNINNDLLTESKEKNESKDIDL